MANKQSATLDQLLVPSILPQVYTFWFQHISSDERLLLPSPEDWKRWFFKSDDFDAACTYVLLHIPSCIAPANHLDPNSRPSSPPFARPTLPQRSFCLKVSPPPHKTG
jgi:hypothetical protein